MSARMGRRGLGLLVVGLLAVAACSSGGSSGTTSGSAAGATSTSTAGTATTTVPAAASYAVFGGDGNNLDAYEPNPPFTRQRVNSAYTPETPQKPNPNGTDINGQICFLPDGSGRFIAGEDKNQTHGVLQGWGIFKLSGTRVGSFSLKETAKLVPTYQSTADNAENYGCGVLSDGRLLTTDVGDQATGAPTGQLIVWYPPFDSQHVKFCKLETSISTAQSLLVDSHDHIFMSAARATNVPGATTAGVWELSPPYPTSPDAAGGCGRTDSTGAPLADRVVQKLFIPTGPHGMATPAGLAPAPGGGFYVSSVFTGVINQYDGTGAFVRTILQPPAGETLGPKPYSTGTPLGLAVAPDGSLFYADIGIVVDAKNGVGPGNKTGSQRRITFTDGKPNPPDTMNTGLDYPDGQGVFVPPH